MKVAIDISPTIVNHKVRGIGSYTYNLQQELESANSPVDFEFFKDPSSPPKADIVHYPYFDLFFHTLPIKRKATRVVTIHDVIPLVFPKYFEVGPKGYINFFLQKLALRNVDAVICDSKTSKADITNKLNYPDKKIFVVYLAAAKQFKKVNNSKILEKVSHKYNLPKKFALYVGDVNWNKNIHNLLEAVKISKISLVMVGQASKDESSPQGREITSSIKKLKIESYVLRTGFVSQDELIAIYNLTSVAVLPSYYEGFGLPLVESMACGTPVVCSNNSSLAEIGPPYVTFCDPDSPADIAKKIDDVVNLPTKDKDELSKKLVSHASKFTWQKVAGQTIEVYKKLQSLQK